MYDIFRVRNVVADILPTQY